MPSDRKPVMLQLALIVQKYHQADRPDEHWIECTLCLNDAPLFATHVGLAPGHEVSSQAAAPEIAEARRRLAVQLRQWAEALESGKEL